LPWSYTERTEFVAYTPCTSVPSVVIFAPALDRRVVRAVRVYPWLHNPPVNALTFPAELWQTKITINQGCWKGPIDGPAPAEKRRPFAFNPLT
jgi:hypothetical protein